MAFPFDRTEEVVKFDGSDYDVGGTMSLNYGLTNRLLAKRKRDGKPGDVRTILTASLSQTYHTERARAAERPPNYQSATNQKFSRWRSTSMGGRPTTGVTFPNGARS